MTIYVDELPKNCLECIFADNQKGYCDLQETRILRQFTKRDVGCPLQGISEHDKQVRKDVCDKVYNVFTNQNMWRALKDWWLNTGNCKELKNCLNDISNDLSVSDVVKKNTNINQVWALIEAIEGANYDKN